MVYRCSVIGEMPGETDPETKSLRYFAIDEMPQVALPYPTEALFGGA